ncbi:MAG TPA: hypothetical protein VGH13_20470 [Xanthobacteraceae bacterium]|jgi:hypothetical protein
MTKQPPFVFAIRDGEGYWFSKMDGGEVFFVSPLGEAKTYDNAAKAMTARDALAQMLVDDTLSVRQVGPTTATISRGESGDENQINWAAPQNQP